MMTKFRNAKDGKVTFWGDGSQMREFLHSDDLADACLFAMLNFSKSELINVGSGENVSIKDLAERISRIANFSGKIEWDSTRPNGTPNRPLDSNKIIEKGWTAKYDLTTGLENTFEWFIKNR
jgi:GDP-L-fucose synthase